MATPIRGAGELFDRARQRSFEARGRRIGYAASIAGGLLFAIVFWFLAGLWWLSLALFAGVALLMMGTTWLVTRNPVPTLRCLGCGGRGWIDDLVGEAGVCPACGTDRFRYYRFQGEHDALLEEDIAGAELVSRRRSIGLPWI